MMVRATENTEAPGEIGSESDEALARLAGRGDRGAFQALIERHYDRVFRVALGVLAQASDAEDLAQEIWASMPKRLRLWRGEARFTTWLHQVTLNAARDALRRRDARRRATAGFAEIDGLARAEARDAAARATWLEAALAGLEVELRATAALVVGEGATHGEAAAALGVAEGTVSWRMGEIRKRLRALAGADDAPPPVLDESRARIAGEPSE